MAALRHPNILQIYDIGESDGLPYVALELLEGGSLADRLRGTPLPPRQAAEWMVPLVLAMDAAHQAGIVHRDLKSGQHPLHRRRHPQDHRLRPGQAAGGGRGADAHRPGDGDAQLHGARAGPGRYQDRSARPPTSTPWARSSTRCSPAGLPSRGSRRWRPSSRSSRSSRSRPSRVQFRVPRDLETICLKCLQKEPRKRYATAKEMADDLNRYLVGEPIRARRTPPVERGVKWAKRHPTIATLLGLRDPGGDHACSATGAWYWNHQRALERIAAAARGRVAERDGRRPLPRPGGHRRRTTSIRATSVLDIAEEPSSSRTQKSRELASLYDRTKQMLGEVEQALEAERARQAEQAGQGRGPEALSSLPRSPQGGALPRHAVYRPHAAGEPRSHAQGGRGGPGRLRTAGATTDDWTLGDLPASLSSEQQTEVKEGCYELLLVLAEAVATQDPAQVDRALRILDSADRLRPDHSRAYHLRKASCLARKDDRAGEARELAEAQRVRPETAFDYFLSGQQEYKAQPAAPTRSRTSRSPCGRSPTTSGPNACWPSAISRRPEFEAAKSCLNDCLQTDPELRLALSAARLRQRPDRRQVSRRWSRPVRGARPP